MQDIKLENKQRSTPQGSIRTAWTPQPQGAPTQPNSPRVRSDPTMNTATQSTRRDTHDFNPTGWVLNHHKDNFILELKDPETKKSEGDVENPSTRAASWSSRRFRVNFAQLQNMRMRKLQSRLVKDAVNMYFTSKEPEQWEETLQQYSKHFPRVSFVFNLSFADPFNAAKACQDYDYMTACSKRERDPFLATGEYWIDHRVIQRAMESVPREFRDGPFDIIQSIQKWRYEDDTSTIGGTRNASNRKLATKGFYKRLRTAAISGVFLLGPMWLMALHHELHTALVSTTLAVALFGFGMSWFLEKESDVLASTAAYAAVLVVFVGLNTPST